MGIEKTPITTMGGLKILPDVNLGGCSIENADALILPGGNTWTETIHEPILAKAEQCLMEGLIVAAICNNECIMHVILWQLELLMLSFC